MNLKNKSIEELKTLVTDVIGFDDGMHDAEAEAALNELCRRAASYRRSTRTDDDAAARFNELHARACDTEAHCRNTIASAIEAHLPTVEIQPMFTVLSNISALRTAFTTNTIAAENFDEAQSVIDRSTERCGRMITAIAKATKG